MTLAVAAYACCAIATQPSDTAPQPAEARDYSAELFALLPKWKEGERAKPLYLHALTRAGEDLDPEVARAAMRGELTVAHPLWPTARRSMLTWQNSLELARRAASRPVLGAVPTANVPLPEEERARRGVLGDAEPLDPDSETPPLHYVHPPMLGTLRQLAHLLAIDAAVAATDADADRLAADLIAICGIARHCGETPLFLGMTTRNAAANLAFDSAVLAARQHAEMLGDQRLADIQAAIESIELEFRTDGELLVMEDAIARLYTDDGSGDGRPSIEAMRRFRPSPDRHDAFDISLYQTLGEGGKHSLEILRAVMTDPGRRAVRELWLAHIDAAKVEAEKEAWNAEPRRAYRVLDGPDPRADTIVLNRLAPALAYAVKQHHVTVHARQAAVAVIALYRFRLDTGDWPARLGDLVPRYLSAAPRDMFTGEPLRYRPPANSETTPALYSVGSDKDDDGGVRPAAAKSPGGADLPFKPWAKYEGDWVFLGGRVPDPPAETPE